MKVRGQAHVRPHFLGSLLPYCHVYLVHMLFEILCLPSTFRELKLQICMTMSVLMWVLGIKTQGAILPALLPPYKPTAMNRVSAVFPVSFFILSINYSITMPYPLSFHFSLRVFCAAIC